MPKSKIRHLTLYSLVTVWYNAFTKCFPQLSKFLDSDSTPKYFDPCSCLAKILKHLTPLQLIEIRGDQLQFVERISVFVA